MTDYALQELFFSSHDSYSIIEEEPPQKEQYLLHHSLEGASETLTEKVTTKAYADFFIDLFEAGQFGEALQAATTLAEAHKDQGEQSKVYRLARRAAAAAQRGAAGRPWKRG